jgi:hypothetical protein
MPHLRWLPPAGQPASLRSEVRVSVELPAKLAMTGDVVEG